MILFLQEIRPCKFKTLLFTLQAKVENHLINEARQNYLNDCIFVMTDCLYKFMYKEKFKTKAWSDIYAKLKGNSQEVEDNRTAKEIEEDTLNMFKNEEEV